MKITDLKPIGCYQTKLDERKRVERVLLKYNASDLEHGKFMGRFYIPDQFQRTGDFSIEFSKVIASSGGWLKEGDEVASTYSLLMVEINKDNKEVRHPNYLWSDDYGNEYCCPLVEPFNIFARFDGDIIEPIEGVVFCELPEIETPNQIGRIIVPETAKKLTTDKKGFRTKVLAINPVDEKSLGVTVNDEILCGTNADITIELKGKKYLRVPVSKVLAKYVK